MHSSNQHDYARGLKLRLARRHWSAIVAIPHMVVGSPILRRVAGSPIPAIQGRLDCGGTYKCCRVLPCCAPTTVPRYVLGTTLLALVQGWNCLLGHHAHTHTHTHTHTQASPSRLSAEASRTCRTLCRHAMNRLFHSVQLARITSLCAPMPCAAWWFAFRGKNVCCADMHTHTHAHTVYHADDSRPWQPLLQHGTCELSLTPGLVRTTLLCLAQFTY